MELKTVLPLVTLLVVTTLHEVTGFDLGESEFCERIKSREEKGCCAEQISKGRSNSTGSAQKIVTNQIDLEYNYSKNE